MDDLLNSDVYDVFEEGTEIMGCSNRKTLIIFKCVEVMSTMCLFHLLQLDPDLHHICFVLIVCNGDIPLQLTKVQTSEG